MASEENAPPPAPGAVLDVFAERDDRAEPLTVSELVQSVGCSRQTLLDHLHELEEDGEVTGKEVGETTVWWVPAPRTPTIDDGLPADAVNRETVADDDVSPL